MRAGKNIKALAELATGMREAKARRDAESRRRRAERPAPKPSANDRDDTEGPTREQMSGGAFELKDILDTAQGGRAIGKAYRRKPMIITLAEQGLFNDRELKALQFYRHHADIVDRSPIRDSLNKERHGGSGNGPTPAYLTACQIVRDCERAAQGLADILRAVVVDDFSLSQWAISKSGAIEDCTDKGGKRVCRPKPKQKALAIAKLEIQMVAKRIEAELSA